jgi:TorA maturation chaperone TorD
MGGSIDVQRLQALSRLFSYPEQWPEARDLDPVSPEGERRRDFYEKKDLQALQAAYVRLFVNALPEIPCPPYGSFYLEGTLMGASTVRLNKLYNEYGFETDELADHIAVELEFLALLTTLSSHSQVHEDYEFLLNHLRQWTPVFFEQVEKNDQTGFYRDVSRYAKNIIFN